MEHPPTPLHKGDFEVIELRFSQRIDYQTDLCRGEASGCIGEAGLMECIHEVGIMVNPLHELLSGCSGSNMRAIELGEFAFAIGAEFHFESYEF